MGTDINSSHASKGTPVDERSSDSEKASVRNSGELSIPKVKALPNILVIDSCETPVAGEKGISLGEGEIRAAHGQMVLGIIGKRAGVNCLDADVDGKLKFTKFADTLKQVAERANHKDIDVINISISLERTYEELGSIIKNAGLTPVADKITSENVSRVLEKSVNAFKKKNIDFKKYKAELQAKLDKTYEQAETLENNSDLLEKANRMVEKFVAVQTMNNVSRVFSAIDKLAEKNIPVVIGAGNNGKGYVNLLGANPKAIQVGSLDVLGTEPASHSVVHTGVDGYAMGEIPVLQDVKVNSLIYDGSHFSAPKRMFVPQSVNQGVVYGTSVAAPEVAVFVGQLSKQGLSVEVINQRVRKKFTINGTVD